MGPKRPGRGRPRDPEAPSVTESTPLASGAEKVEETPVWNPEQVQWRAEHLRELDTVCSVPFLPIHHHAITEKGMADPALLSIAAAGAPFTHQYELGQVTVRLPATPLSLFAILYGFIPFVLFFYFAFAYVVERRKFYFCALFVVVLVSCINELCIKPIFKEPRPPQAACMKPGFPSGHSMTAYALLVWFYLVMRCCGPSYGTVTIGELILSTAILAPTPWARWYNLDHTFKQVSVSAVLGIFVGVLCFAVSRYLYPKMVLNEYGGFPLPIPSINGTANGSAHLPHH
eukprot:TRINITY_DN61763_c0_g1_i1.p1 TRINITY_DN61763_c0_g1~~TRINITY_DN61763_c0_g1_i1.p1  ORF type:complete len:287 (+),score=71.46 TRINITY_DN61763_c0_g1_i1:100-960(+)